MPRKCSCCSHPSRVEIDSGIVAGLTFRLLSTQFGVSESSIRRHKAHVQEDVQAAAERRALTAESVLLKLDGLALQAEEILADTRGAGKVREALFAIREVRETLKTLLAVLPPPAEESAASKLIQDSIDRAYAAEEAEGNPWEQAGELLLLLAEGQEDARSELAELIDRHL